MKRVYLEAGLFLGGLLFVGIVMLFTQRPRIVAPSQEGGYLLPSSSVSGAVSSGTPELPMAPSFASSSASSTDAWKRANCPKWVNCMPGPDMNHSCVIPSGCEGYTRPAY